MPLKLEKQNNEFLICLVTWSSAVLYAIYSFTNDVNTFFQSNHNDYDLFDKGWEFLKRPRDKTDLEYEDILYIFTSIWPLMIVYILISEVLIQCFRNVVVTQCFQIAFTLSIILYKFGKVFLVTSLVQPIVYTIIFSISPSKRTVYICLLVSLIWNKFYLQEVLHEIGIKFQEMVFIASAAAWVTLKCTSYYLENMKAAITIRSIFNLFGYCFYLPVLFCGPFIFYDQYANGFKLNKCPQLSVKLRNLFQSQFKLLYWLGVTYFGLHYIYLTAVQYYPEALQDFGSWSLYGLGYIMGQFFHLKYILLYGLGTSLAKFQNVDVPPLPRCIGRIHLYTDMWRFFDVGFYKFILSYIYIPTLTNKSITNKLFSSALTFIFVWMWHGFSLPIFIWTFMNFIGVTLETSVAQSYNLYFKEKAEKVVYRSVIKRLTYCLCALLMVFSSISNFYYFAGIEITNVFVQRLFEDPWYKTAFLVGIFYTLSVVSVTLRNIPAKSM